LIRDGVSAAARRGEAEPFSETMLSEEQVGVLVADYVRVRASTDLGSSATWPSIAASVTRQGIVP